MARSYYITDHEHRSDEEEEHASLKGGAKNMLLGYDEAIGLVIQVLLWCSCWGMVDAIVSEITGNDALLMIGFYFALCFFGGLAYFWLTKSKRKVSVLHPKVPEFIALVASCVGSWGLVNSFVTFVSAESAVKELLIYSIIVCVSGSLAVLHHRYRRPNFILDQLV